MLHLMMVKGGIAGVIAPAVITIRWIADGRARTVNAGRRIAGASVLRVMVSRREILASARTMARAPVGLAGMQTRTSTPD
jgi:hypothetical protein